MRVAAMMARIIGLGAGVLIIFLVVPAWAAPPAQYGGLVFSLSVSDSQNLYSGPFMGLTCNGTTYSVGYFAQGAPEFYNSATAGMVNVDGQICFVEFWQAATSSGTVNFTAGLTDTRPQLVFDKFNGWPAVYFDGNNDYLSADVSGGAGDLDTLGNNFSVYLMAEKLADTESFLMHKGASPNPAFYIKRDSASTALEFYTRDSSSSATVASPWALNTPATLGLIADVAQVVRVDGAEYTGPASKGTSNTDLIYIGGFEGASNFFQGYISEVIIWPYSILGPDVNTVEGDLSAQYEAPAPDPTPTITPTAIITPTPVIFTRAYTLPNGEFAEISARFTLGDIGITLGLAFLGVLLVFGEIKRAVWR